jgi:hypothetical protein
MALTKTGVAFFRERFFALNAKARVENTVGDRVFSYTGIQAVDTDQITVWLFEAYAGLKMTDKNDIEDYSNVVGVVTNPSSLEERVASAFGLRGKAYGGKTYGEDLQDALEMLKCERVRSDELPNQPSDLNSHWAARLRARQRQQKEMQR